MIQNDDQWMMGANRGNQAQAAAVPDFLSNDANTADLTNDAGTTDLTTG
jgi:hypothetical protein